MKVLQETIRNLQTQLLDNSMKERENVTKINNLEQKLKQANVKELLLKTQIIKATKTTTKQDSDGDNSDEDVVCLEDEETIKVAKAKLATTIESIEPNECGKLIEKLSIDEAHLISLISTYLVIHPFGATINNLHIYLKNIFNNIELNELKNVLNRYKNIFYELNADSNDISWKFIGFDVQTNIAAEQNDQNN